MTTSGIPLHPVTDERDHFYVCAECGEAVDRRDLAQVIHHEQPGHEPMRRVQ